MFNLAEMEDWEFGAAGISNPRYSTLKRYFELFPKIIAEIILKKIFSYLTKG